MLTAVAKLDTQLAVWIFSPQRQDFRLAALCPPGVYVGFWESRLKSSCLCCRLSTPEPSLEPLLMNLCPLVLAIFPNYAIAHFQVFAHLEVTPFLQQDTTYVRVPREICSKI